jgi:hypothetical protein
MRQVTVLVALTVAAFAAAVGAWHAAPVAAAQETPIYMGNLQAAPAPITIGGWGSGSLQEVSDLKLVGGRSLKFVSQGDFQGGLIKFAAPLDISTYAGQRNAYIELWVRPHFARPEPPPPPSPSAPGAGAAAAPSQGAFRLPGQMESDDEERLRAILNRAAPRVAPPPRVAPIRRRPTSRTTPRSRAGAATTPSQGATQSGTSGQRLSRYQSAIVAKRGTSRPSTATGAGTTPGAAPTPPEQAGPASAEKAAFRTPGFRVQLVTDRGVAVLSDAPIYPGDKNDAGWVRIGLPLSDFDGPIGDKLQSIAIFSDRADTLYLGEIRLLLDTSEITARPGAYPAITNAGEPVTLVADASAGLGPVETSWDFDSSDGIQQDAQGARVVNVYTRAGAYVVTATIRDATGANAEPRVFEMLVQVK